MNNFSHSPMSKDDISDVIDEIKSLHSPYYDGVILSLSLTLAHKLGLKNHEIFDLVIGDVMKRNRRIRDAISIREKSFELSGELKQIIREHIRYLREKGYRLDHDAPLMPMKNNRKYYSRQLFYHFKLSSKEVKLAKIRKSGICHFFDDLRGKGMRKSTALQKTVVFARCAERQTKRILKLYESDFDDDDFDY